MSIALAAILVCTAIPRLVAAARADIHALVDQIVRKLDLQTALPAGPQPSAWHLDIPPMVLLAAALVMLAVVAYQFRDMVPVWRGSRRDTWADASSEASSTEATRARPFLALADELAAEGRLVEAMHSILLQSIAEMRASRGEALADSLTSREILRDTRLSERGKTAFREIVTRVERHYFGDYPPNYDNYTACKKDFTVLIGALRDGGAP